MNAIVNADEIRKAVVDSLSSPSEDIARDIMLAAGRDPSRIDKAITTGTGLVAYDLQAPAKNLYPVNTPLIRRIPRTGGGVGTASNWKTISGLVGSGFDNTGWVPEGQRAGQMSYVTGSASAAYATLGEEDQATWEAISAGRTFEDIRATMTMRLLQKMKLKEESSVLFGNLSIALGTPATPSLSQTGSTGTLPTLNPYSVIVVALTMEGYRNSSLANGVATSKVITGADGKTFTSNGGSSMKSAAATQAITLGQILTGTVTAIQGAVAYAWYIGAAGSETLQAITTINSLAFGTALAGGRQAATAVTADCSKNVLGFDGLLTSALKSGSGAYIASLATGTAGTGSTLTSNTHGGVSEIDTMMQSMWDTSQVSPSILLINSQQQKDITAKVLSTGSSPLLQYMQNPADGAPHMTAGGDVRFYYNPYLNMNIPIVVHPQVSPGTILGWAENLPEQYMSTEVPNIAEMKVRRDYYQVDWPYTTRADMTGVYLEEVLAVYAPFAMGVITNIAAG